MRFVRLVIGSVLAAVLMFVWGFLFWVVIPQPSWGFKAIPGEHLDEFNYDLALLEPGTYVSPYPGQVPDETEEEMIARHEVSPIVYLNVDPDGAPMISPVAMGQGFVHGLLAALAMGFLLLLAAPALPGYSERVKFVWIAGIFCAIWAQPNHTIWFNRSCGVTTWYCIYDVLTWMLAGLVLAYFVTGHPRNRRKKPAGSNQPELTEPTEARETIE